MDNSWRLVRLNTLHFINKRNQSFWIKWNSMIRPSCKVQMLQLQNIIQMIYKYSKSILYFVAHYITLRSISDVQRSVDKICINPGTSMFDFDISIKFFRTFLLGPVLMTFYLKKNIVNRVREINIKIYFLTYFI